MNYLFLAAITTFFSFPPAIYEQNFVPPPAVVSRAIPAVLGRIAMCESQGKQHDEDGNILLGTVNKYDIGKYQINALYWDDEAKSLGLDIYTEEGNEAFALELYDRYGTSPWKWSKKCWNV
ncbi:hypothetical protein A2662_02005 [Candidatus Giovannonibacteria bacterium RIFCSPHIGHO2_01_FULL_45_33]|nr:MAG: hypothetical protein A2662_02005 [Candidatus Giovannonibacteria bacterium RIFCSPHIGHO2_01_FULL_45_33]OGF70839.1 MAG: hypothetical protein A3C73_00200 [Candidatus Giovannonibacteria bacterium RIFCSPHIGHO2_02_FULL_44_11]